MVWYGSNFIYEGIQLTAAHSGGRCSDLIQEEVQHIVVVVVIVGGTAFIALSLSALSFVPIFKSLIFFWCLKFTVQSSIIKFVEQFH